jgi:hypothetical membrane protein
MGTNKKSGTETLLLTCGAVGGIIFFVTYSVFGFLTPGYHAFNETISSLEMAGHGWVQQINFILYGILNIGFAVGLAKSLKPNWYTVLIITFQSLSGLALIGDGLFIYEPLHFICDLLTFNSSLLLLFLFIRIFYKAPDWKSWVIYTILTAVMMMFFLTAFGLAHKSHGPAGLYERLAVLPKSIWTIILAVRLLSGKSFY